jgi:hypothetical protein
MPALNMRIGANPIAALLLYGLGIFMTPGRCLRGRTPADYWKP